MDDTLLPRSCQGRYTAIRPIAAGGFGAVILVRQIDLARPAVLKVLRADVTADPEHLERFKREAAVTASLVHPNVVTVYDHGVDRGVPWIVFEYLPGRTLREFMQRGRMAPGEALAIGLQLALALEAVHGLGIVHRDVKPENVIAADHGLWKLTDFGIARWSGREGLKTQAGVLLGTPAYMAPEYISGALLGPSADLYALGVVLFELVTGRLPFDAQDSTALLTAHLTAAPPRPGSLCPGIPSCIDELLARCLAKSPEQRHGSSKELAADLSRLMEALRFDRPPAGPGPAPGPPAHLSVTSTLAPARAREGLTATVRARRPGSGALQAGMLVGACLLLALVWFIAQRRENPRIVFNSIAPRPTGSVPAPGVEQQRARLDRIRAIAAQLRRLDRREADMFEDVGRYVDLTRARRLFAPVVSILARTIRDLDHEGVQGSRWLEVEQVSWAVMESLPLLCPTDHGYSELLKQLRELEHDVLSSQTDDPCRKFLRLSLLGHVRPHTMRTGNYLTVQAESWGAAAEALQPIVGRDPQSLAGPRCRALLRVLAGASQSCRAAWETVDPTEVTRPQAGSMERERKINALLLEWADRYLEAVWHRASDDPTHGDTLVRLLCVGLLLAPNERAGDQQRAGGLALATRVRKALGASRFPRPLAADLSAKLKEAARQHRLQPSQLDIGLDCPAPTDRGPASPGSATPR